MRYLLDTNVVSDLVRNPQGRVADEIARVGEARVCTSIIVASELRYGAEKRGSARLTAQLEAVLGSMEVLSFEAPADAIYGVIRVRLERMGMPIGGNDLLIAAQAVAVGCTIVSDNEREFARVEGLQRGKLVALNGRARFEWLARREGGVPDIRSERFVLVAGASGFVGGAVVDRLAADPRTRVVGVSRSRPANLSDNVRHIALDLLDVEACRGVLPELTGVTHLVYAAVNETPGDLIASWTDPNHASRNGRMCESLLDPVLEAARGLRQVVLMHGTKAYASHLPDARPIVPMRESLPRPDHDDFYYRQEDHLWAARRGADWRWTVFRAPMIAGGGRGSNLNALLAICVFASLRRAAGLALPFPGARANLGVMEMVDVNLLARAVDWSLDAPEADDQVFNVANGDVYVWPDLWPAIAAEVGLPVGEPEPMSLAAAIDGDAALWADLVRRHGLDAPEHPRALLGESAALADFALGNCGRTVVTSTIKLRSAGFHDCVDTTESVRGWIRRWRTERLLPPA